MNTPKIILYKHKTYTDKTHPIILQVIKNGKPIRKVIGRCLPSNWLTSKNRVSSKDINSYRINEAIEDALKNYGVTNKIPFKTFFQNHIDNLESNQQVSRYTINKSVLKQMTDFYPSVDFDDITESFIYKLCGWLRSIHGNNKNTIREKMNVLSKILKMARKAKIISNSPMEDMSFPKEKVIKTKLNVDDIQLIMNHEFTGRIREARDVMKTMLYMRGARVGDVLLLTYKNIVDNRLVYRELKTGEVHDISIRPELKQVFDEWMGKNKQGYIFSFMDLPQKFLSDKFLLKKALANANAKLNRYVKIIAKTLEIEKNVSPHTMRHSFSKIANEVIKNTSITKDLVGHKTLTVHEGYISDISDNNVLDSYADTVLDQLKE